MWKSFDWTIWDLVFAALALGVGIGVTGCVYLLGQAGLRRLAERRRGEPRRWGNPQKVLLAGEFPEPLPGMVVNRSDGGLALLVARPLEADALLSVRAQEAPERVPWVQMRVRHCHPEGREWLIGCQFTETVPWSVSVWFG